MTYPKIIYADTDLVCGEEPNAQHQKYIRSDLVLRMSGEHERRCMECGALLTGKRPHAMYCGDKCKWTAWDKKHPRLKTPA